MAAKFILDISRLFSRRHLNHDTGIDRVERGYLEQFRGSENTVYLIKFAGFRFIFSKTQIDVVFNAGKNIAAGPLSKLRTLLLLHKKAKQNQLPQKLKLYKNATYINVGPTGHKPSFWNALKQAHIRVIIMIHDVIPLDYPEYSRADKIKVFERKFQNWCQHADVILTPSQYSKSRISNWSDTRAEIRVTKLFVPNKKLPKPSNNVDAWIILGTIEPRKNHMLLFKAWETMVERYQKNTPKLWIIGARGWPDNECLKFLEHSDLMGKYIIEMGAIDDEAVFERMAEAKGVLFPSFCEGFGLPLYEAVLSEKAIFASRIPAFEEALGHDSDCLLTINDYNKWVEAIMNKKKLGKVNTIKSWKAHIDKAIF